MASNNETIQEQNIDDNLSNVVIDDDILEQYADGEYDGYDPYTNVSDASMSLNYGTDGQPASSTNPAIADLAAEQPQNTNVTATQPTQAQQATPSISPEQTAYENALAEKEKINAENVQSLRDYLDMYKPETPEEKAKRERMERTRQNIVGFSNMAAALGNLATAASSDTGRAVKVEPSSDDLDKAIQRERGIREARDAKGHQLRNQYMALRKQMADDKLSSTWQAYRQKQANDIASAKIKNDNAKAAADNAYKWARLEFDMGKQKNTENYRNALLKLKKDVASANKSVDKSKWISLPLQHGRRSCKINPEALKVSSAQGALESLLPSSYFSKEDNDRLASARQDQNGALYADTMMRYIGKYLRDGGIILGDKATMEERRIENARWTEMMNVLKSMEAEFIDTEGVEVKADGWGNTNQNVPYNLLQDDGTWNGHPMYNPNNIQVK